MYTHVHQYVLKLKTIDVAYHHAFKLVIYIYMHTKRHIGTSVITPFVIRMYICISFFHYFRTLYIADVHDNQLML